MYDASRYTWTFVKIMIFKKFEWTLNFQGHFFLFIIILIIDFFLIKKVMNRNGIISAYLDKLFTKNKTARIE